MPLPDALGERLDRLVATAQAEQRTALGGRGRLSRRRGRSGGAPSARRTWSATSRRRTHTRTASARSRRPSRPSASSSSATPGSLRSTTRCAPTSRRCRSAPPSRTRSRHLTGLQREPAGDVWESLEPPTREELLAGLEDAERVLEPGQAWHYSNLAFGLLGEVVARHGAQGYEHGLRESVLAPLGLDATGFDPAGPRATGYYVDPFSDGVTVEPDLPVEGPTAAMGWLWSTVDDLARWGDFLATGRDDVLARASLDEMARVRTMVDHVSWEVGWGLGLGLYRRGDRVYAGHGGAMPGFLAMLLVDRRERTGAAVLANTSAGFAPDTLALDLAEAALETLVRTPDAVAARRRRSGRRRAAPRPVVVGGLRARRALEGRPPRDRAAGRPAGAQRLVARRRRPRTAGGSSRAASSASSSGSSATRRASRSGCTSRRTR